LPRKSGAAPAAAARPRVLWENFRMEKLIDAVVAGREVTPAPRLSSDGGIAVLLCVLYVALDWITYVFPLRFGIPPFNPEAAVAVAALTFCGLRWTPLVFVVVVWGEYALPAEARPWALILINAAVLTGGYAVLALLFNGRFRIHAELDTRRDVLRLIGVTFGYLLVSGVAYVGVLVLFGIGDTDRYFSGTRRFFISYSVGMLVAAPLLFMAFSDRRRKLFRGLLHAPEAWVLVMAILLCVWWLLLQPPLEHPQHFYLLFLPLIWAATRFGMAGSAGALLLMQAGMLSMMYYTGYQPLSVFDLQLLFIALAITGLLLGVTIDEQRRAAQDYRESLKLAAAGEMAAAITHEINQPLTALSGYAAAGQLIASAPQIDRARLNDTMGKLMEESKRTSAVVRRLRDFFRSGETRLEPVNLGELAANTVQLLHAKARGANVTLTCAADAAVPVVMADPVQIEVVLRNLLLNAIESAAAADPSVGSVRLETAISAAGEIMVTVTDSGKGIRAADAQRLFESFVTTKTSGMGMGLAISRAIVEAHGGRIWAAPGATGRFGFTLPADAALAADRRE
jgi:two-component system, LuxR family, sensor kinase FixL